MIMNRHFCRIQPFHFFIFFDKRWWIIQLIYRKPPNEIISRPSPQMLTPMEQTNKLEWKHRLSTTIRHRLFSSSTKNRRWNLLLRFVWIMIVRKLIASPASRVRARRKNPRTNRSFAWRARIRLSPTSHQRRPFLRPSRQNRWWCQRTNWRKNGWRTPFSTVVTPVRMKSFSSSYRANVSISISHLNTPTWKKISNNVFVTIWTIKDERWKSSSIFWNGNSPGQKKRLNKSFACPTIRLEQVRRPIIDGRSEHSSLYITFILFCCVFMYFLMLPYPPGWFSLFRFWNKPIRFLSPVYSVWDLG